MLTIIGRYSTPELMEKLNNTVVFEISSEEAVGLPEAKNISYSCADTAVITDVSIPTIATEEILPITQEFDAVEPKLSKSNVTFIMIAMMVCMLLAALDQTIVATAIRTIGDDLDGYSMQAWVTTAYLITSTLATPLYGKLSDIFGRRPLYLTSIIIFILGSLVCSFCTNMSQLSYFRALQGLGGGGLMSLSLTIIGDISTPKNRPKFQSAFIAVFAISSVIGPLLGGVFAGQDKILGIKGWRWVFLVNVPIGIVALILVALYMVLHVPKVKHKIDYIGSLGLAIALVPLLIVAEQGREWGWLSSKSTIAYLTTAFGLVSFIFSEYVRGEEAILPLRVFKNKTFALGVIVSIVIGVELFSGMSLLPQYFQVVKGYSPTGAGLLSIPQVIGMTIASVVSGHFIAKNGRYRIFTIYGGSLICVVFGLLYFLSESMPLWIVLLLSFFIGFCLGNLLQPITIAIQNSLPKSDMSISSSSATFFRSIGGTLGVAAVLSVLFANIGACSSDRIAQSLHDPTYYSAIAAAAQQSDTDHGASADAKISQAFLKGDWQILKSMQNNSSIISQLSPQISRPIRAGFSDAIGISFGFVAAISLLGWVLLLLWKEQPIDQTDDDMMAAHIG